MSFDSSIKVTDILTLVGFLLGGFIFVWSLRGDLKMLAKDVKMHSLKIDKLETIIVKQAAQDERMNAMDRRLDELRHWRGFVNEDVNGVYTRYGKIENIP